MKQKSYSLTELGAHLKEVIRVNYDSALWLRAEISECRENSNGHCYLEFIEKDTGSDQIRAKMKGTIWANNYRMMKPYFEESTGQTLRAGLNVLVAVTLEFHEVYGLSLNVRDIDPSFTLGELALRRLEVIRQLESDGVVEMNKMLGLPLTTQRIAIISSASAAGYEDFCNQLNKNERAFVFYTRLYPAIMQGDQAADSIIAALERIYEQVDLFDVVVIIRGGGASTDLSCFDSYELALNVAQFPLPILSGIGHQRDLTILDMVTHTSVKTPTAAAEFLIAKLSDAEDRAMSFFDSIREQVEDMLTNQQHYLTELRWKMRQAIQQITSRRALLLDRQHSRLKHATELALQHRHNQLEVINGKVEQHSPSFLLKYGYTITTYQGKRISSAAKLKKGNQLRTYFSDGDVSSTVD